MSEKRRSLARRLTLRLIIWQVLTLTAFAMCVPLIDFAVSGGPLNEPDPTISDDIAASLHTADGVLELRPTEDFRQLIEAAPGLWFVVSDTAGRTLRYGDVPKEVEPLAQALDVQQAAGMHRSSFYQGDALFTLEQSPVGEVSILFGNGTMMSPLVRLARYAVGDVLPILLVVLGVLAVTTAFVIPRLVRSSMVGLRLAVSRAGAIDLDRPGTQLPTSDVPAEIAALVEAMNAALRRIDDGHERHKRFLADAAHELRTPIAVLQNRIELLAGNEAGRQLLLDVQRLANLAEQLLDLQRMNHKRSDFRVVDLVTVAKGVMSDLAPMAVSAGYEPHFSAEASSVRVMGDSSAIERAIINVVQNAIAYGGNRGRISLAVLRDGAVEVSDDGEGVPPDQKERIFEPFHRLKPIERGAGLGLNLVRQIMSHHDGTASVLESPSGGARFVLQFSALPS